MPKVSRETASETIALEGLEVQLEHLDGGYSVCFESHTADADLADLFRGLPDDRCQLPRWGYVIKGRVAFRLADREETYEAGEAYVAALEANGLELKELRTNDYRFISERAPEACSTYAVESISLRAARPNLEDGDEGGSR